jgi:NAD(P)-dependent dehydrogenase (short-subunit alcohol dehydrogenase family)
MIDFSGQVAIVTGAGRGLGRLYALELGSKPTADDIHDHFDEVSATEEYMIPDSIVDEVLAVCDRLGISPMPDGGEIAFPEPTGPACTDAMVCAGSV